MEGMILLISGMVIGGVFAYCLMWKRTRNLEDKIIDQAKLIDTAVDMIRKERKNAAEWKKVNQECDSVDFSKKW